MEDSTETNKTQTTYSIHVQRLCRLSFMAVVKMHPVKINVNSAEVSKSYIAPNDAPKLSRIYQGMLMSQTGWDVVLLENTPIDMNYFVQWVMGKEVNVLCTGWTAM